MNGALRTLAPRMMRRCYATAVSHGHDHGHGHGRDLRSYDEAPTKPDPRWVAHPESPVATFDDFPIPVLPYKDGYAKTQASFNGLLAASVIAFVAMSSYIWANDVIGLSQAGPPKWYTHRKVGKGLGEID